MKRGHMKIIPGREEERGDIFIPATVALPKAIDLQYVDNMGFC